LLCLMLSVCYWSLCLLPPECCALYNLPESIMLMLLTDSQVFTVMISPLPSGGARNIWVSWYHDTSALYVQLVLHPPSRVWDSVLKAASTWLFPLHLRSDCPIRTMSSAFVTMSYVTEC
jgi:hypothetical protein